MKDIRDVNSGLTAARLREVVRYEPEIGKFFWLKGNNQKKAEDEAGSVEAQGYLVIGIDRRRYKAHRLVWLYVNGTWPENEIDHVNLNRSDNRWCNLRQAVPSENCFNRPTRSDSSSGIKGVYLTRSGRYAARISKDSVEHHIGTFDTSEQAKQAYNIAAELHHGEFARAE